MQCLVQSCKNRGTLKSRDKIEEEKSGPTSKREKKSVQLKIFTPERGATRKLWIFFQLCDENRSNLVRGDVPLVSMGDFACFA